MAEVEPYVRGASALHSPTTAIVDFPAVAGAYADDITQGRRSLRLGYEVAGIERTNGEVRVRTSTGEELAFDRLVVCGGLYSDRLAQMAGEGHEPWIVPFRGEYYKLVPERPELSAA